MPNIAMCSSAMVMVDWLDALKAAAGNKFDAFEITCVFPSADPEDIKQEPLDERCFENGITLEVINVGKDPEPELRCRRVLEELLG